MKDKKQFALIIVMLFLSIIFLAGGVFNIFKGFHNFNDCAIIQFDVRKSSVSITESEGIFWNSELLHHPRI